MSYTNHTTHYELPQWVRDDKPTFLSDMNGAFDKIDRALHDNASAVADTDLEVARVEGKVDGYGDRLDTVEVKVTSLETAQTGLDGRITHNSNDINTINSLIGNGEPTTQDKTIIGAINELAASGTPAEVNALKEKVGTGTLDTVSQNCVGAINEVNTKVGTAQNTANTADSKATANANKIGADPLTTTAQTLTGAINEINAKPSGGGDTVTITPALQSGTKVADYTINGVAGSLYAPTGGGGGGTVAYQQTFANATAIDDVGIAVVQALNQYTAEELMGAKVLFEKGTGVNKACLVLNINYFDNMATYYFNGVSMEAPQQGVGSIQVKFAASGLGSSLTSKWTTDTTHREEAAYTTHDFLDNSNNITAGTTITIKL